MLDTVMYYITRHYTTLHNITTDNLSIFIDRTFKRLLARNRALNIIAPQFIKI